MAPALERELGFRTVYNYASSSVLSRQIEAGAPADVFISANPDWVDWLEERGAVLPESRVPVLENTLAIVAPRDAPFTLEASPDAKFADAFRGRLALPDPAHVPAGMYARAALESAGWWDDVADRLVATGDVRAALALVERGEVGAAIVYATDARSSDRVVIVCPIPEAWHAPIRYPAVLPKGARVERARAWLAAFRGDATTSVLVAAGFRVPRS